MTRSYLGSRAFMRQHSQLQVIIPVVRLRVGPRRNAEGQADARLTMRRAVESAGRSRRHKRSAPSVSWLGRMLACPISGQDVDGLALKSSIAAQCR